MDTARTIENRTLMDMLPDVITSLNDCSDGAGFLGKRRQLDKIQFILENRIDLSTGEVFPICK